MDLVIVSRLKEYGLPSKDPWGVGFDITKFSKEGRREPLEYDRRYGWTAEDHEARIRFIMDCPEVLNDPIVLDCFTGNGRVYAVPTLIDGHHRLAAHLLLGRTTIPVDFSGRVDLLRYLTGESSTKPEE